jgi:hypothetical protein
MNARPAPLCRRALLQYAIGAAGGLAISYARPTPAAAGPKISKKAVAYQDHPDGDKQCVKCVQFQPPDACKMVEGPIRSPGILPHLRADPAFMRRTSLWNKSDTGES